MTVKEIETLIPVALERFKQRIPQSVEWIDNVPIRVATRHTGEKMFRSTIKWLNHKTCGIWDCGHKFYGWRRIA